MDFFTIVLRYICVQIRPSLSWSFAFGPAKYCQNSTDGRIYYSTFHELFNSVFIISNERQIMLWYNTTASVQARPTSARPADMDYKTVEN